MKNTILLVDNDSEARELWERILSEAKYNVLLAGNPAEARQKLQEQRVNLAVIDLRLENDKNSHDISGLLLAKDKQFRHIPKIILTAFDAGYSDIRDMLGPVVDELPPTVAFVKKDEPSNVLIDLIRETLNKWPRMREVLAKVSDQIRNDHKEARRQAQLNYWSAFALSVLGGAIILVGIALAWSAQLGIGLVGTTGGILVEMFNYLFLARVNRANDRMDSYHHELLQTYWFDFLLAASEELPLDKRIPCQEQIINTAATSWLSGALKDEPGAALKK